MTPNPEKGEVAGRPLFDPDPKFFVAKLAVEDPRIKRCRLSDFVLVAFAVLLEEGYLEGKDVKWFEGAYTYGNGLKLRKDHNTDGSKPVSGPGGTVMEQNDVIAYTKFTGQVVGENTVNIFPKDADYRDWLEKLKQGAEARNSIRIGTDEKLKLLNQPLPDLARCRMADIKADKRLTEGPTKTPATLEEHKKIKDARIAWPVRSQEIIGEVREEVRKAEAEKAAEIRRLEEEKSANAGPSNVQKGKKNTRKGKTRSQDESNASQEGTSVDEDASSQAATVEDEDASDEESGDEESGDEESGDEESVHEESVAEGLQLHLDTDALTDKLLRRIDKFKAHVKDNFKDNKIAQAYHLKKLTDGLHKRGLVAVENIEPRGASSSHQGKKRARH